PGGDVALAQANGFVEEFSGGEWTQVAAPGFGASDSSVFSSPSEGWLAGSRALGHWHLRGSPAPLVLWPEANRSTLTRVAVPPPPGARARPRSGSTGPRSTPTRQRAGL